MRRFSKRGGGGDAGKRGGAGYTAGEFVDQGTLTCPRCTGGGTVQREHLESDEDGGFAGADVQTCPRCDGSGKVRRR